uniref:Uncharacterized protein n=1 Tax=Musca domestica TaxID=7370 RepID=A0A1I8N9I5_MUSDO
MTNPPSKAIKYNFLLCTTVIITSLVFLTYYSGFRHESKKFAQILVTIIVVLVLRYLLMDHIEGLFVALYKSLQRQDDIKGWPNEANKTANNSLEYLKLRLVTAKAEFYLPQQHKNEAANCEYLLLTKDLWLFGRYFFLLLLMIVYSRNSYGFFNTRLMRTVFVENRLGPMGLLQMKTIEDVYAVINWTMSGSLCQGVDYRGLPVPEYGWMDYEMAKLLGVVRLKQLRVQDKSHGMKQLQLDRQNYLPQWKVSKRRLYYVQKYWRTYYPWLCETRKGVINWLPISIHKGSLYGFSAEQAGYESFLARDLKNNAKILKYLQENSWLDPYTVAVLIDFTLYNADGNMFSLISLLVEQTPFGGVIWQLEVQSVVLLTNLEQLSAGGWFLIVIYILHLMEFSNSLFSKWWWMGEGGVVGFLKSPWNCVDLVLILLNLTIAILLISRESWVKHLLITLASAHKLEYLDFRTANFFDYMATIGMGFLVSLTTIRLWKILQFASVFRLFTTTLYSAAGSLIATLIAINIFLFAMGFAAQIVNGAQTEVFSRYLKSLTSIMSFSFGFNSHTRPEDLSHGGNALGFMLYLVLMFGVAIFLINMFITLICDHFAAAAARRERDNQGSEDRLSYWQFLKMESPVKSFRQGFNEKLQHLEEKNEEKSSERHENLDVIYAADMRRSEHIRNVANILKLQMEILNRELSASYLAWESDEEGM